MIFEFWATCLVGGNPSKGVLDHLEPGTVRTKLLAKTGHAGYVSSSVLCCNNQRGRLKNVLHFGYSFSSFISWHSTSCLHPVDRRKERNRLGQ
jgi:hypothetical protein